MNFKAFNRGIENIIETLSYEFYLITWKEDLKCKCVDATSKEPKPDCLQCLGLGRQIKIKKVEGYQRDDDISIRSGQNTESIPSVVYYMKSSKNTNNEMVVVDGEGTYVVNRSERLKSSKGKVVYKKLHCTPKKNMSKLFLRNFYKVVKK